MGGHKDYGVNFAENSALRSDNSSTKQRQTFIECGYYNKLQTFLASHRSIDEKNIWKMTFKYLLGRNNA